MKKILIRIFIVSGLCLSASCGKVTAGPTGIPTQSPVPIEETKPPKPTEISELPELTSTPEPTEAPEPTSTPELTKAPEPTSTPEPTKVPEPTSTPEPTKPPIPTESPEPTVAPELLVLNGWQKTKSIEDEFFIIFPDLFQDSYLKKTELELLLGYTALQHTEVEFRIVYRLQQTLAEAEEKVLLADGKLQKEPSENRTAYVFLQEEKIHQGYLYEMQYSRELLGSALGDEEQITGVMWVELSYPESRSEEYQQEKYRFYVIENREDE